MKKILLAALVCLMATSAAEAQIYWRGLATNNLGLFVLTLPEPDEASARKEAKRLCGIASLDEEIEFCERVMAAPIDWYLVGIYCSNGYDDDYHLASFVAGNFEELNEEIAKIIAQEEDWFEPENCGPALVSPPMPDIPEPDGGK